MEQLGLGELCTSNRNQRTKGGVLGSVKVDIMLVHTVLVLQDVCGGDGDGVFGISFKQHKYMSVY